MQAVFVRGGDFRQLVSTTTPKHEKYHTDPHEQYVVEDGDMATFRELVSTTTPKHDKY